MYHHHHVFWDIRHFVGQVFWSVISILLLVITMYRWLLFGEVGIWLRIVLWSVVLLFLPWYRITEAVWHGDRLDYLEHMALSFAFSLSVVPLLVFYVNLIGFPITQYMVLSIVIALLVLCIGLMLRRKRD